MNDQIILLGFEPPEYQETRFLDSLISRLKAAVEANGGVGDLLTFEPTTSYTTVAFHTFTAFRLKLRGKQYYISLPTVFSDLIQDSFPTKQMKSDSKYIRILVDETHPIESYTDFLVKIAGETVNRYPKEWDCCSRYMACSDAMTCIHPDKAFALGCGYRKILNSGRIFYGRNRNIERNYTIIN